MCLEKGKSGTAWNGGFFVYRPTWCVNSWKKGEHIMKKKEQKKTVKQTTSKLRSDEQLDVNGKC